MSVRFHTNLTVLFVFLSLGASASSLSDCPSSTGVHCASSSKRILEVPRGAVDGINDVFVVAEEPQDPADLRLFVNGSEMTQGAEFKLTGRELTMANHYVPTVGSLLQVSYTAPVTAAERRSVGGSPDKLHATTRTILLQSIAAPSVVSTPPTGDGLVVANKTPTPNRSAPVGLKGAQSIALLARMIDERHPTPSRTMNKKSGASTLSGFEGVGDLSLANPYASILDGTARQNGRSLSRSETSDASSHDRLRSFTMLIQRLESPGTSVEQQERK